MSQFPPPPPPQPMPYAGGQPPKPIGFSVTALVLGIASFLTCCIGYKHVNLGMLVGIAAIVVGLSARKKVALGLQRGGGMAMAGLILGIVNVVLQVVVLVIGLAFGPKLQNWAEQQMQMQQQRQQQSTPATTEPVETMPTSPASPTTTP